MFLIVGLGNPGREYRDTRHNIGFMVLDRLAIRLDARFTRLQSKALIAPVHDEGRHLLLAKPQTFMNLSGQAVRGLARFYRIAPERLLVIHDDLDLPVGALRLRLDGGAAGHKGILSIVAELGTEQFVRLRVGIGRPPGQMEAADYVLQPLSTTELLSFSDLLERAAEAALTWAREGLTVAMNRFNGLVLQR
ncbi:MAG: aminoacyl-tRNA hydrolase [Anaerolineales bacterium]|nr:aminoacyl-tRNA hydrolase [Anaerolineales bacterium]